jgi:ABC-2 type transport system permease protein
MVLVLLVALLLGLLASFVAQNEFQAVQTMPVIILPQIFLSDLIWSIDSFPSWLRWLSYVVPITHANIAAREIMLKGLNLWQVWPQLAALVGLAIIVLMALNFTARRAARLL